MTQKNIDDDDSEEENDELTINESIIDDSVADPFISSPDMEIKSENDEIENPENDNKTPPLDSDLLFQDGFISSTQIHLNSGSDNSASLSQIQLNSFINDSTFLRDNQSIEKYNSTQTAKKYPPPNISVYAYFQDLISRIIKCKNMPSKEEIYAFVKPYSIEQFAKTNFRKSNSLVPETIKEMTTFSNKPLSKPLLKKIDSSKKPIISKLSTSILTYIKVINTSQNGNDESSKQMREKLFLSIMKLLRNDESLVDECLMQLIKLMRKNPSMNSLLLCWKIFITVVYLFFLEDKEILNVVYWFLVHRMYSDEKQKCAAYFSFICIHDRNVIGRNCKETRKTIILQIPYCAFCGNKMFMCSLYEQVWHQKRKYPHLPIPLMLHLVVKTLIKNGVMVTPNPVPLIYKSSMKNSSRTATAESTENTESNSKQQSTDNYDSTVDKKTKKSRYFDHDPQKMKILYDWINELPIDNNAIKNGEVYDLMTLLLEWLSNLVDPIIPKSMINEFKEIFDDELDLSSNSTKYNEFIEKLPSLHLNTLKYLIGFLREIGKNEKLTQQSYQIIAENTSGFFVDTKFATIDPFTMKKICDVAPRFVLFCLQNLDVSAVYPLNPIYESTPFD